MTRDATLTETPADLVLVLRCCRCRAVLNAPPLPWVPAGGFWWPCPTCSPEVYLEGHWLPTGHPEAMFPEDVRFVPNAKRAVTASPAMAEGRGR
jgi:hypothetical protein